MKTPQNKINHFIAEWREKANEAKEEQDSDYLPPSTYLDIFIEHTLNNSDKAMLAIKILSDALNDIALEGQDVTSFNAEKAIEKVAEILRKN